MNDEKKLLGGRYECNERIGEGGEGTVFKGYDVRLKIPVAVKQFHENSFSDSYQGRGISFDHPSFPRVTDIICEEGSQYIVMDYLDGPNGAEFVQNFGVLKGDNLREIAIKICHAMKYLHDVKKVLHMDLKPENIIFCRNGEMKFVDMACMELGQSGKSESKTGTPGYAAPEVCNFGEYSKSSEVYAFGATLYFLATGKTPSPEKVVFPSLHNKYIDSLVEVVIMTCLRTLPSERFGNFDDVLAHLSFESRSRQEIRNHTMNFINNAELAFEYAYIISKKLNKNVLVGLSNKAFQFLDERLVNFDTHHSVAFLAAVEASKDGRKTNIREFAVQPDGMRGVFAVVIPEQEDLRAAAKEYILEASKEFDCLIYISLMESWFDADINICSLPENIFEIQSVFENLKKLNSEFRNFRYVIFDGILNFEEAKNSFVEIDFNSSRILTCIPRPNERNEARVNGGIVTMQMQKETENAYLQLAYELGFQLPRREGAAVYDKQTANGNQTGRYRRNEEGASLWKHKMGGNKNWGRH